jgi:putative PIN family toxin of toxin-antitoxin system
MRAVIDTNVLAGAMLSEEGTNRAILRNCFEGKIRPLIGQALLSEYEDVIGRESLFRNGILSRSEREELLDALLSVSEWVRVYFGWRPNLQDEGDNHLIELAVAGQADWIITNNVRHLTQAELKFPGLRIGAPSKFLKERL